MLTASSRPATLTCTTTAAVCSHPPMSCHSCAHHPKRQGIGKRFSSSIADERRKKNQRPRGSEGEPAPPRIRIRQAEPPPRHQPQAAPRPTARPAFGGGHCAKGTTRGPPRTARSVLGA